MELEGVSRTKETSLPERSNNVEMPKAVYYSPLSCFSTLCTHPDAVQEENLSEESSLTDFVHHFYQEIVSLISQVIAYISGNRHSESQEENSLRLVREFKANFIDATHDVSEKAFQEAYCGLPAETIDGIQQNVWETNRNDIMNEFISTRYPNDDQINTATDAFIFKNQANTPGLKEVLEVLCNPVNEGLDSKEVISQSAE